jgi:TetR/AcrR family transcriptional regulator, mexJK operon transcriptional repressor
MRAISSRRPSSRQYATHPRPDDPRVVRSRAAAVDAATTLFLQKGYAGTTMEEIAALAGITKRTLYNNYADKSALFIQIVTDVIAFAEEFARGLSSEFAVAMTTANLSATLHDLGRRLALRIVRPEVIALRRLLIGEARAFPELAKEYFDRAPGRVLAALTTGFEGLHHLGLLQTPDARRAAEQFAYLVAGEPLDRAMLVGKAPGKDYVTACARDGVETFLARYVATARGKTRPRAALTTR